MSTSPTPVVPGPMHRPEGPALGPLHCHAYPVWLCAACIPAHITTSPETLPISQHSLGQKSHQSYTQVRHPLPCKAAHPVHAAPEGSWLRQQKSRQAVSQAWPLRHAHTHTPIHSDVTHVISAALWRRRHSGDGRPKQDGLY